MYSHPDKGVVESTSFFFSWAKSWAFFAVSFERKRKKMKNFLFSVFSKDAKNL